MSNKIRLLRSYRGLSQVKLSQLSGVPQYKISMIENGKYNPSELELNKLSSVLVGKDRNLAHLLHGGN